jgi:hypothetical protein
MRVAMCWGRSKRIVETRDLGGKLVKTAKQKILVGRGNRSGVNSLPNTTKDVLVR